MIRLTNDNPHDNLSSVLNLFYVKDKSVWVRGGGPGPGYEDISLDDYVRIISQKHDLDIAQSENDEDISCEMNELLFDGTDTVEGIIATLYTAGWAFAELRERLFSYEDTCLTPEEIMGLCKMDKRAKMAELLRMEENKPLTMEEMREMGRRPVWFHWLHNDLTKTDMWRVISGVCEFTVYFTDDKGSGIIRDYGNTWLAYRREPEEAGKEKGKLI